MSHKGDSSSNSENQGCSVLRTQDSCQNSCWNAAQNQSRGKQIDRQSDLPVCADFIEESSCSERINTAAKWTPCKGKERGTVGIRDDASQQLPVGEKPHPCRECGKGFRYGSVHPLRQSVHPGEKCFSQRSRLQIHQRSHSGEKPSECRESAGCFTKSSCHSRQAYAGGGAAAAAAVAGDSAAARGSLLITELTLARNRTSVRSVGSALVRVQIFSAIRESTLRKNPTDVKSAARASVGVLTSMSIRGLTGVRNPISVKSVERALPRPHIFTFIRECTLGRSPTNVTCVGRASVTIRH